MHLRLTFKTPIHPELVAEAEKGVVYASAALRRFRVVDDGRGAEIDCDDGAELEVSAKVERYVESLVRSFRPLGAAEELASAARRGSHPLEVDAFAGLERRGWARRIGPGLVGLAGGAVALKRHLDDAVSDLARRVFGAREEDYPALVEPETLARAGYLAAFPHSTCLVGHLAEDFDAIEVFRAANADSDALRVPDPTAIRHEGAALRPAVCIPVYRALQGSTLPEGGSIVTTSGKAFRYESKNMGGLHRLWDFTMREIVFAGSPDFIEAQRARVVEAVVDLMRRLDLAFRLVSATDPFFATVRGTLALWQRARHLKHELLVDVGAAPLAVGSINVAGTLFGDAFDISTSDGATATTACVGFGLERLVLALFVHHGFEPGQWPPELREVVFE